ncbi:MAG: hypothetical protein MR016_07050 [Agathobacter sp.]|nr:hypothetical protein [Agathobacter sp.]
MQKYITWYWLLLKEKLHTAGVYLQIASVLLVAFTITQTTIPDTENVTVGIVCNNSSKAEQVMEQLVSFSDVYDFVAVDSEETLRAQVERAEFECGFVFDEAFDRMMERESLTDSIRFYCSQATNKGDAIVETVYSAVLEAYSGTLLEEVQQKLYKEKNPRRQEKIMDRFYGYLDSDEVFQVTICRVETTSSEKNNKIAIYPLQGWMGMLVALGIFLSGLRRWEQGCFFYKALDKREAERFFAIDTCASGTIPALICLCISIAGPYSRGCVSEVCHMAGFFLYTVLWCAIAGKLFRSYLGMLAAVPVYVVANVLICPVIFDIVTYVPAMQYVRILFPLGIYLL